MIGISTCLNNEKDQTLMNKEKIVYFIKSKHRTMSLFVENIKSHFEIITAIKNIRRLVGLILMDTYG